MPEDEKLPFTSHLEELRKRLITCFIAVGICFVGCYAFSKKLFEILMRPLLVAMPEGEKLIYTGLPEAFFTYLKVALLAALLLAVPIIMYQIWMFIAPGLYHKERRWVLPIVFLSSLFFTGGGPFRVFRGLSLWLQVLYGFCLGLRETPPFHEPVSGLFSQTPLCLWRGL